MTLEEIASHLEATTTLRLSPTGTMFLGFLPDEPDESTALYEYGGSAPSYTQDSTGPAIEYSRVHVVTRGPKPPAPAGYKIARQTIREIYDSLAAVTNATLGTPAVRYLAISPVQEPFDQERDAHQRVLFAFNVEAWKEPS